MMSNRFQYGNSLVEYALPLVLFVVGGLAVSITVDVPALMQTFFASSLKAEANGNQMAVKSMGRLTQMPAGYVVTANGLVKNANGLQTVTLTQADGSTITLKNYPANITEAVETTGANGATNLLASTIQSLAEQLESTGGLNASQATTLKDLANQGYYLAQIYSALSAAPDPNKNVREF